MPKQRSNFLRSLGKLFTIFKKVLEAVQDLGGSDEDIAKIDTDDRLPVRIAALLLGKSVEEGHTYYNVLCVSKHSLNNNCVESRWHLPITGVAEVVTLCDEKHGVKYNFRTVVRFQDREGTFVGFREGLDRTAVVLRVELVDEYPFNGWELYTDTPAKPSKLTADELRELAKMEVEAAQARR